MWSLIHGIGSPLFVHRDQEWSFWDSGSGGKKTLFNVCNALAVHAVALERDMPGSGSADCRQPDEEH